MDLDALRYGNLSKLGEAVTDWQQMTKKLADLQKDAESNLKAKADRARWAGINASVSREFIGRTAAEFADAHTQADSIAKILGDTHGELVSCRTQLNEAIERGARQSITVLDTGEGTFAVMGTTRPDWASDPSGNTDATDQKAVEALRNEIQGILAKATQSDTSAAKVLRMLADQAEYGFADASYADRDSAAAAVAAAERLAKMAKDPADMTLDEIADFNRTMTKYHGDSLFAEQFATRLGAKGTLQFWTDMTATHAGARGAEFETMKSLQQNLSMTLATASFSDSDAMQDWKRGLVAETNTVFHPPGSRSPVGPLGAQIISSLMRQGQYDTEFLDDYRKKVFKTDSGAGAAATDELWVSGYDGVDLVFGDGSGRDPLEGLFEGLSHNPEAATHAFTSKSDVNHMLDTTKYTDRGESLGRALEAAVTGVAAGDSFASAPPHSETQVRIMNNIMGAVANPHGGAELVKLGLGESFGDMAASYMPEISQAIAGKGSGPVFITNSDDPGGLELPNITRFLSATSADTAGRAGIIFGESIYISNLLEAHLADRALFDGDDEQVLRDIGKNAGVIEGIVAHSAANSEVSKAVEGEKDYSDALKAKGDFAKSWVSIGATFIQVPAEYGGAAAGAVAGGLTGAVAGAAVDRLVDAQKIEGARDEALYYSSKELFRMRDSVTQQTQLSVSDALARHHVDLPPQATNDWIRQAVGSGWQTGDYLLSNTEDEDAERN